jgi:indole-3-glycerol phosphate synthase
MTFDTILDATRAESGERQRRHPLAELQRAVATMGPTRGFARALRAQPFSVIGEIKRKSPSMGEINPAALEIAHEIYREHPLVGAISILTQHAHFGGSAADLQKVRELTAAKPKPLLRKDFIFSAYEVYFSRWIGADAILLMANVLRDPKEFKALHDLALSLGLDVLCEVHETDELRILPDTMQVCGINSRRFKGVDQKQLASRNAAGGPSHDTQTDLNTFALFSDLPAHAIKVAESGISSENVRSVLARYPFNAALIGTSLLRGGKAEMAKHLDRIRDEAAVARGATQTATAG